MTLDSFNAFTRNSHASKRFVDIQLPSWAKSVVFGLSLGLHVLPYCVDYDRTGSTGLSESLRLANAISDKLAQFSSGSKSRMEQNR